MKLQPGECTIVKSRYLAAKTGHNRKKVTFELIQGSKFVGGEVCEDGVI